MQSNHSASGQNKSSTTSMDGFLQGVLGDPVSDPEEEAFLVFSQTIPSQSLGFIDPKASSIDITVAGRDLTIHQSRGLLTSDRKEGTTGAVVWKVTPLFAEWLASPTNFLFQPGCLLQNATTAIELGTGVSGIVALTLGPKIQRYVATDQDYVIRLLKQNIEENLPTAPVLRNSSKSSSRNKDKRRNVVLQPNIDIHVLDWELNSVGALPLLSSQGQHGLKEQQHGGVDLVLACDCVYNDALIAPLNSTCADICRLRSQNSQPTLCLMAQQLRSPEIFEAWLTSFHGLFHVYRVPNELLTQDLRENSGFVVHVGILRR